VQNGGAVEYTSGPLMTLVRDVLDKVKDEAERCKLLSAKSAFAKQLGIEPGRLRSILYQAKSVTRDELRRIFEFGDKVASKSADAHFRDRLEEQKAEVADVVGVFTLKPQEPYERAMRAVTEMCRLAPDEHVELGQSLAGAYLLFRRDHEGQLILSSLRIAPPARAGELPGFSTYRRSKSGTRRTMGFLYIHEPYICALGHTVQTRSIRLSLLHPITTLFDRDLAGLRLSVSTTDKGAFAHPVYLHRIDGDAIDVAQTGKFQDVEPSSTQALRLACPKFDAIVAELDKVLSARPAGGKSKEFLWRYGVGLEP